MLVLALTAVVACSVVFLSSHAPGTKLSAVLALAHSARAPHELNGHQHPTGRTHSTAFAEDTETKNKLPANVARLTAFLLGVLFGTAVWWFVTSVWTRLRSRVHRLAQSRFFAIARVVQRRRAATLSEVFRL